MSSNSKRTEETAKDRSVIQTYGVLTALDAVKQVKTDAVNTTILINDIMAYIRGDETSKTALVEQALSSNLTVRRQYRDLLKMQKVEHIAKPRAAHSEAVFEKRVGTNGVLIKLKQSKGNASQYYLIIEASNASGLSAEKSIVLHANTERLTQRAVFPPLHDGRTQIILGVSDPLFDVLQDHDVEIDIY